MKARIFLTLLAFLCLHQAWSQSGTTPQGTPMDLVTSTGTIKGTLLLPTSSKPVKVVLLHAGSGPTDRDGNIGPYQNNSLKMLAEALYAQGIATVRYDKRGIGESKDAGKKEEDMRFHHFVEDATAWVQKLKADKRFSKVVVLGHSEGSLIGMQAAQQAKADGFISVAGPGKSADQVIREQLMPQPKMVQDIAFPILDSLVAGKLVPDANPMLQALFRPAIQPYLISWFQLNPQVEIRKLKIPVLLVQGTQDMQVSTAEAQLLKEAYPAAKLVLVENMNHVLKPASADKAANLATYSNPELALSPTLAQEVTAFVKGLK
ncbi:alpha/beta fold hydrolase [Nibribacter ruber]|uniref:Alpha/beta fold hydrolase n=1 Tax=Nibribacter ruber TaxID=2698458 RepID=A0A6P1NXH1_9BACT|nr:alpha/beta fold hydrolase [Nibribacter ruber]QHL86545.1 alpha/beta fold hydrolase [Nibribacter ruber]